MNQDRQAVCDRCLAVVPVIGGVVDAHLCRSERRQTGWRPTLADIRNGRRLSATARFVAERTRMWGA